MVINNCIYNLLKVICLLQNNSSFSSINHSCDKPYLGPNTFSSYYNSRVLSLYSKDGSLFTVDYSTSSGTSLSSSVFRLMEVQDDYATFLILNNTSNQYRSTNQFITIPISCICAIRCLSDVNVPNL